jgi:hypothetical protein
VVQLGCKNGDNCHCCCPSDQQMARANVNLGWESELMLFLSMEALSPLPQPAWNGAATSRLPFWQQPCQTLV